MDEAMILYLLACATLGYMEAILFDVCNFSYVNAFNKLYGDIHRHFVAVRIILYLWAFKVSYDALLYLLPCVLMFPLVHDGVYYVARHYFITGRISVAPFTFQSTTTTAKMSYPFWIRCLMFVAGMVGWILI